MKESIDKRSMKSQYPVVGITPIPLVIVCSLVHKVGQMGLTYFSRKHFKVIGFFPSYIIHDNAHPILQTAEIQHIQLVSKFAHNFVKAADTTMLIMLCAIDL